jgi:ketosteroid isomerase-like protein
MSLWLEIVATVVNNWRLSGSAPDGTPVSMSGTSADVMRHRPDGTWGILIDDPWAMPAA